MQEPLPKTQEPNEEEKDEQFKKEVDDSEEHIIDLLDKTIENQDNLSEHYRLTKLKHIVSQLKDNLPENFQEAYNHPDPKIRAKWREGIKKEFRGMKDRHVWRRVKRRDMPQGRRCVKCRWVFEIKRNGIFRPRLVAWGYSQIPGMDFTES